MPRVPAWFWFWFWVLMNCASVAQEIITAEPGQDVILPCRVLNNNNKTIILVKWNTPELDPDYVLLYRNGKLISDGQLPSFKNRVYLQDREMKDGDVSLFLKNVKMEDTGIYECRVVQRETNRRKRSILKSKPIIIIHLDVLPPGGEDGGRKDGGHEGGGRKGGGGKGGGGKDGGDKDGGRNGGGGKDGGDKDGGRKDGIVVGAGVGVILLLAVASVGVLIYRRLMRKTSHLPAPPDEASDVLTTECLASIMKMIKPAAAQQSECDHNDLNPRLLTPSGGGGVVSSENAGSSALWSSAHGVVSHDRLLPDEAPI